MCGMCVVHSIVMIVKNIFAALMCAHGGGGEGDEDDDMGMPSCC